MRAHVGKQTACACNIYLYTPLMLSHIPTLCHLQHRCVFNKYQHIHTYRDTIAITPEAQTAHDTTIIIALIYCSPVVVVGTRIPPFTHTTHTHRRHKIIIKHELIVPFNYKRPSSARVHQNTHCSPNTRTHTKHLSMFVHIIMSVSRSTGE